MIRPSVTVYASGGVGLAALAYGAAAKSETLGRSAALVVGIGRLITSGLVWLAEDTADKNLMSHPELMNGFFLTGGKLSAVSAAPPELAALRGLMGVPAGRRRRRRGNSQ